MLSLNNAFSEEDLINFDFNIPEFFDKEKFKINRELITNKMTKSYINENSKLEYIFKIILSSFNKKRKTRMRRKKIRKKGIKRTTKRRKKEERKRKKKKRGKEQKEGNSAV